MLGTLLLCAALAATNPSAPDGGASAPPLPPRGVPSLGGPSAHGQTPLQQLAAQGLKLEPHPAPGATVHFVTRVGVLGDALWVRTSVEDAKAGAQDSLVLSLEFPAAAGPSYTYRFGVDGRRSSRPEDNTPDFAQASVKTTVEKTAAGFVVDARLPLTSFPRFPLKDELVAQLCLTLQPGGPQKDVSTCTKPPRPDDWVSLPNALRELARQEAFGPLAKKSPTPHKAKHPKADAGQESPLVRLAIVSLEARPGGWAAYDLLHFPVFLSASAPLTHDALVRLVGEPQVSPSAVRLAIPAKLATPEGSPLDFYLTGQDPFATEGKCQGDRELRMAFFLVNGKTATRVLEWPASTCALGRASSVGLDEDGALTIGYSGGATVSFTWSRDHFERTQMGER